MRYLLLLVFVLTSTLAEDLLKDFSEGNTKFSADVYKQLIKKPYGDFIVSPLSLQTVLALVDIGAKGQTAQQLSSGLHLPENLVETEQIFSLLSSTLIGNNEYNLSSANKIYFADSFKIKNNFERTAEFIFHAPAENIDFSESTKAASEINKWVESETNGAIKNLVKAHDLGKATLAILINAMHFQGVWTKGFPLSATKERPFHLTSKDQLEIDMMEGLGEFNYYESSRLKAKFLELPYLGKDVTMTIVLPNKVDGLRALEGRIASALTAPQYKRQHVNVVLPKFKIGTSIKFKPILQALGITDAFGEDADFSGITDEHVRISKVIQKAVIEVDEKGTTAAAGTQVQMIFTMGPDLPRPKKFTADHPFIFYLKYKSAIMFVGRYKSGHQS